MPIELAKKIKTMNLIALLQNPETEMGMLSSVVHYKVLVKLQNTIN